MARLIDSSVLIELERRARPFETIVAAEPNEVFAISSVTAGELLVGVERARPVERRAVRAATVERIFVAVTVIPFDVPEARIFARLWAELANAGFRIGDRDLMIAATALSYGYELLTHDLSDFTRVPGLVVRQPDW